MRNNTFEDYKKAIQAKYEIEKEGVYFNFLSPPSQANLRNLCWEIFNSNTSKEDLKTFHSFFDFEFDLAKKNHFKEQTDRFRPIGSFLKGEKVPANRFAVELAAVLVDFQPRPYKKYKERGIIVLDELVKNPNVPETFLVKPLEEIVQINTEEESDGKEEDGNEARGNQIMGIASFGENDVRTFEAEGRKHEIVTVRTKSVGLKSRLFEKLFKRSESAMLAVTIIFCLIAAVIYFAFIRKECMQWTGDHYEKVDCDIKVRGGGTFSKIVAFDETEFFRQKIKVCDTTTYFKEGQPIIWYAKDNNKVDFFNMLGIHPENKKTLRPVTDHIFNKYKEDCQPKTLSK